MGGDGERTLRIGVLISGSGTNLQSLIDGPHVDATCPAKIVLVLSNRADAQGLARAQAADIPQLVVDHRHRSREDFEDELIIQLDEAKVGLVVLAGFMRILTARFVNHYRGRLINTHPALLPAFPGMHAVRQALAAEATMTGCTIHWVTTGVDAGPTIRQASVPIEPGDDENILHRRILAQEHRLLPQVVRDIAEGRVVCPPEG